MQCLFTTQIIGQFKRNTMSTMGFFKKQSYYSNLEIYVASSVLSRLSIIGFNLDTWVSTNVRLVSTVRFCGALPSPWHTVGHSKEKELYACFPYLGKTAGANIP